MSPLKIDMSLEQEQWWGKVTHTKRWTAVTADQESEAQVFYLGSGGQNPLQHCFSSQGPLCYSHMLSRCLYLEIWYREEEIL